MRSFVLAASLAAAAHALNGIVVPGTVAANTEFQATFQDGNSDKYRVYLAAALAGVTGPTCTTTSADPTHLTVLTMYRLPPDLHLPILTHLPYHPIPAAVGPSADYYSIAITDLTTSKGATYSNRFNFTGGTGNYTEYETHLGGAPFWDADDLPCSSYACARRCAQSSYPNDLSDTSAYDTMKQCILSCPGVSAATSVTSPAHATATSSGQMVTRTAGEALITLGPRLVMTAMENTVTSGGSTFTETVLGSLTIMLGGAKVTVSSKAVSMLSNGVEVGGTTTVAFSSAVQTLAISVQGDAASGTSASASATSSGAAGRHEVAIAGAAGVAGLAAMLL